MHQEQIDRRRDTAATIDDDVPVLIDTGCSEFRGSVGKRGERLALRIDQGCRRHIDAPWYATRPAVATWLQTFMELRAERIDDHDVRILACGEHPVLVDEAARSEPGREDRRWITLGRTALDRKILGQPFIESAIEHGSTVEAERL